MFKVITLDLMEHGKQLCFVHRSDFNYSLLPMLFKRRSFVALELVYLLLFFPVYFRAGSKDWKFLWDGKCYKMFKPVWVYFFGSVFIAV